MTLKIGAHVSIAGGIWNAVQNELDIGGNCGQVFTHSPRSWNYPEVKKEDARLFREALESAKIGPFMSHATYLQNLASQDPKLYNGSIKMVLKEAQAASALGIPYVCFHPGTHGGASDEKGIERISTALKTLKGELPKDVTLLLENTAGSGTWVGYKWQHLKAIIDGSGLGEGVGVCLDTQHSFAAGYDWRSRESTDAALKEFNEVVGKIGVEGMKQLVNHPRLRRVPFVLETTIDSTRGHKENIEVVKRLYEE